MGTTTGALAAVVAVAVIAALLAYWVGSQLAYGAAKAIASVSFVGIAVFGGALTVAWSAVAVIALVIAVLGDVALAFPGHRALVIGMSLFSIGYLTLAAAFTLAGIGSGYLIGAGVAAAAFSLISWNSLRRHLAKEWSRPTALYHVVVTIMLATGIAAALASSRLLLLAGVVLLAVSDIAVARERFVSPGIRHKLWGLPVYYAGMVLVALSLAVG